MGAAGREGAGQPERFLPLSGASSKYGIPTPPQHIYIGLTRLDLCL